MSLNHPGAQAPRRTTVPSSAAGFGYCGGVRPTPPYKTALDKGAAGQGLLPPRLRDVEARATVPVNVTSDESMAGCGDPALQSPLDRGIAD